MVKEILREAVDIVRNACVFALDQIFNQGRVRSIIITLDAASIAFLDSRSILFNVNPIEDKVF